MLRVSEKGWLRQKWSNAVKMCPSSLLSAPGLGTRFHWCPRSLTASDRGFQSELLTSASVSPPENPPRRQESASCPPATPSA